MLWVLLIQEELIDMDDTHAKPIVINGDWNMDNTIITINQDKTSQEVSCMRLF